MHVLRALALLLFLTQLLPCRAADADSADPKLTPGDTFDVTVQDVCVPGYAKKVRAVPKWLKKQAYARYGIAERKPGDYKLTPADGIRMNWESFPLVESRPASVRPMSVEFLSKLVNRLIPTIRQACQWCITGAKLVYQYQSGVAPGTLMLS
jgi:hypothetical protein